MLTNRITITAIIVAISDVITVIVTRIPPIIFRIVMRTIVVCPKFRIR